MSEKEIECNKIKNEMDDLLEQNERFEIGKKRIKDNLEMLESIKGTTMFYKEDEKKIKLYIEQIEMYEARLLGIKEEMFEKVKKLRNCELKKL